MPKVIKKKISSNKTRKGQKGGKLTYKMFDGTDILSKIATPLFQFRFQIPTLIKIVMCTVESLEFVMAQFSRGYPSPTNSYPRRKLIKVDLVSFLNCILTHPRNYISMNKQKTNNRQNWPPQN